MGELPAGTVTFLFTDLEGSTRRWEQYGQAMARAQQRHDTLLRDAIQRQGGHTFRPVGDGFCAVFAGAP
jgi:class 3 adenylate cyclase